MDLTQESIEGQVIYLIEQLSMEELIKLSYKIVTDKKYGTFVYQLRLPHILAMMCRDQCVSAEYLLYKIIHDKM